MTDREKVIKGLECCLANGHNNCPYKSTDEGIDKVTTCTTYLLQDALAMLRKQEPVRAEMAVLDGTADKGGDGFELKEQKPIVLCQNCKYCEYPKSEKEWCKKGHLHGNAETWFCADGERR